MSRDVQRLSCWVALVAKGYHVACQFTLLLFCVLFAFLWELDVRNCYVYTKA